MRALARSDEARQQFLVHGDAHAGNIFRTADGTGLIEAGFDMLDVGAVAARSGPPVTVAGPLPGSPRADKRSERDSLGDYVRSMRAVLDDLRRDQAPFVPLAISADSRAEELLPGLEWMQWGHAAPP